MASTESPKKCSKCDSTDIKNLGVTTSLNFISEEGNKPKHLVGFQCNECQDVTFKAVTG